jgi:hypothetical protein
MVDDGLIAGYFIDKVIVDNVGILSLYCRSNIIDIVEDPSSVIPKGEHHAECVRYRRFLGDL